MTSATAKKQILEWLHQGNLSGAKLLFSEMQLRAPTDQLSQYLLQAKIYLYEGHYHKALPLLEACVVISPGELEALSDLALCYYHLGLLVACEKTLQKAVPLLKDSNSPLSQQEALNHGILIAKLFEERARLDEAFDLLSFLGQLPLSAQQEQTLRIQLLRLNVEKQDRNAASLLYTQIVQGCSSNLSFEIEREHILLLADDFLFGFAQACERFNDILQKNLCPADHHFILSEMTELAILAHQTEFLKTYVPSLINENEYEKLQAQIVADYLNNTPPLLAVTRLEKTLSTMSLLRLLRQALLLFPEASESSQWVLRYKFHSQQLSDKTLRQKFLALVPKDSSKVLLNSNLKTVSYHNKEVSLESPLFWQLSSLFSATKQEISLEEIIPAIYGENPNEQHYDRLRMALSRINKQLKATHNINAFYKLTKSKVLLLLPIKEIGK